MNFLVSAVTHLPPIKVAQRKQYKELPSPQVGSISYVSFVLMISYQQMVNDSVLIDLLRVRRVSPGPTQSTSISGRSVSTPSPAGLATCLWSTLSFAWTQCSLKTRCLSCARSTKIWREHEDNGQNGRKKFGCIKLWSGGLLDSQTDQSVPDSRDGILKAFAT